MDFNPFDGQGNPLSALANDAAIAALAGGAALGGALTHSRGKIYNVPLKMILKNPKESMRYLGKGYQPVTPDILNMVKATKPIGRSDITSELRPGFYQPDNAEIPGTLLPDNFPDELWYRTLNGIITKHKASDFADTGYMPVLKSSHKKDTGELVPTQAVTDMTNKIKGKTIRTKNKDNSAFQGKERDYTPEELDGLIQQFKDVFAYNNTKVPMSALMQERKSMGKMFGKGGMFSRDANKVMDAKLTNLANFRPEVVKQIQIYSDSTGIPMDQLTSVYSYLSGGTNHLGAMSRLQRAIDLYLGGGPLPGNLTTKSGRLRAVNEDSNLINTAADMLNFGGKVSGNKKQLLEKVLKDIANPGTGVDSAILDSQDLARGYNLKLNPAINNSIFNTQGLYNPLVEGVNKEMSSGFINDFLGPYSNNKLANIQSILRLREAAG